MIHQDRAARGNNRPIGRRRLTAVGGITDNFTGIQAGNHHILRRVKRPATRAENNGSRVRHRRQGQLIDRGAIRIWPAHPIMVFH